MEAVALVTLLLVVVVKAYTIHSINGMEAQIRTEEAEEADVSRRLHETESAYRQLEQDAKGLEQETKHLENDRDLICLEITKLGGTPIALEQIAAQLKAAETPGTADSGTSSQPAEAQRDPAEDDAPAAQPDAQPSPTSGPEAREAPSDQSVTEGASSDISPENDLPKVLVVDDNNELRSLLHRALESDYDVMEAPDGLDALTKILKQKQIYDLIITDLKMPKINGITLAQNLPDATPVIVISGFVQTPEFKESLSEIQPAAVLEKPFQISALRNAIQKALSTDAAT